MATIEEIDKAISAHALWKARLKTAIAEGKIETPVETIRLDNQCAFGKWLEGSSLMVGDRFSTHFQTVKELHAVFHRTAASVAELATWGKRAEAEAMMAPTGEYSKASARLTQAMIAWKKDSQ